MARIVHHEDDSSSSWRIEGPFDREQQESTSKRHQEEEQEANFFTHHKVNSNGCQIIKTQEQQWSMDEKGRTSLCAHDQFAAQQPKRIRLESNQPSHQNSVRSTTYDAMVYSLTESTTSHCLFFLFSLLFCRDAIQVKSHAQWYFKKQDKKSESKQTPSFLDLTDDGNDENTTHHSHLLAASPMRVKNETVPNTRTPLTLTTPTPQRDFPFAGFLCSCVHDGHACGEYYVNVGAKEESSSSQNSNKRYYSKAEMDTIFSLANLPLS